MLNLQANAKINLTLNITGKRDDGYHNIKSVMQSVSLHDILTFTDNADMDFILTCTNPNIPCDERNIVYKAANAFFTYTGKTLHNLHIHIEKNIPSEAGLGGGSADGAAALAGLNKLAGNPCTTEELCKIGAKVGADIPFCIVGGTCLCEGIGDVLTSLPCLPECKIVLYKGSAGVSTKAAYAKIDEHPYDDMYDFDVDVFNKDLPSIAAVCSNIFEQYADIEDIKRATEQFISDGALCSVMSGSGSAVYGIFDTNAKIPDYQFGNGYFLCTPERHGILCI